MIDARLVRVSELLAAALVDTFLGHVLGEKRAVRKEAEKWRLLSGDD